MAAMVARPRWQPTPKAIAAARGGYCGSRRTAISRRSWERGKLVQDGTTATNFAVERRGGAPAEKREREERPWLEPKTCSPTPGRPPPPAAAASPSGLPPAIAACPSFRLPPARVERKSAHRPPAVALRNSGRHPPTPPAHLKAAQEPLPVVFCTRQVPPSAR